LTLFKDDIITIFTHELKTPLNAIIVFSEYIKRNLKKTLTPKKIDKLEELASKVHANGIVQLHMIESILEASRVKSGTIKLNLQKIKPYSIYKEIIDNYKSAFNKNVVFDMDKNLVLLMDPKICKMVFENLFSNALKYSKSQILITLKAINNSYILSVEDDGNGINEKDIEKIFNLFEQADKEVKKREKTGTGVGLYTVKHLTAICNKKIEVTKSDILGGAKFFISDN
jgi:signal transduction histidine kinase